MADEEYVEQEEGGIKGLLTRQLGPLPVWSWAVVIIGGVLLYKMLRGGVSTSSSGGVVAPTDNTGGGLDQDPFSGTLISGLLEQVRQTELVNQMQQARFANAAQIDTAQSSLLNLLNSKTTLVATIDNYREKVDDYQAAYAKCTTTACRTKYRDLISKYKSALTSKTTQLQNINTKIAATQSQLVTLGNVTFPAPSTTDGNEQQTLSLSQSQLSAPTVSIQQIASTPITV